MKSETINYNEYKINGIKDTDNCTITALATAARLPYEEAYRIGKEAGRKHADGFYLELLMHKAFQLGINCVRLAVDRMTIKTFIQNYPVGRFIVNRRGHAFAIINGIVYDHLQNSSRQIIKSAWMVDSQGKNLFKMFCSY
jgi:hypothetical protein